MKQKSGRIIKQPHARRPISMSGHYVAPRGALLRHGRASLALFRPLKTWSPGGPLLKNADDDDGLGGRPHRVCCWAVARPHTFRLRGRGAGD